MHFAQMQISKIIEQILEKEDGLNTILKMTLETLMKAELTELNLLQKTGQFIKLLIDL